MKNVLLIILITMLISCKKETLSYSKNVLSKKGNQDIVISKIDTIPKELMKKYELKKHFNFIIKSQKKLYEDIIRIYSYNKGIHYKEIKLDNNLTLSTFIFPDEVQYDYIINREKIIFKLITPSNKAIISSQYKDWNHDNKPEFILNYEQCENGCMSSTKNKTIYSFEKDTVYKIITLKINNVLCYDTFSKIEKYDYSINNKNYNLKVKKIIGKGKCDNNDKIYSIDSTIIKSVKIKLHDNKDLNW